MAGARRSYRDNTPKVGVRNTNETVCWCLVVMRKYAGVCSVFASDGARNAWFDHPGVAAVVPSERDGFDEGFTAIAGKSQVFRRTVETSRVSPDEGAM